MFLVKKGFSLHLQEKHLGASASVKAIDKQKETLESSRSESRFKVVATRRNLDVDELDDDNLFHLLDIVQVTLIVVSDH